MPCIPVPERKRRSLIPRVPNSEQKARAFVLVTAYPLLTLHSVDDVKHDELDDLRAQFTRIIRLGSCFSEWSVVGRRRSTTT